MKLDNVFIGYTRDGKRHLLYRKYREINDCSYSEYTDLDTKEVMTLFDLNINSLINIKEINPILLNKKYLLKRKIKIIYRNHI